MQNQVRMPSLSDHIFAFLANRPQKQRTCQDYLSHDKIKAEIDRRLFLASGVRMEDDECHFAIDDALIAIYAIARCAKNWA